MLIGGKDWWLEHINARNNESLEPLFLTTEDSEAPFLMVHRRQPANSIERGTRPEARLTNFFATQDLILEDTVLREEKVSYGKRVGHADFVGDGYDGSKWVIEFEVVEKEHGVGEGETSIFYGKMGEGIGQSLLYASAYARKYPSQGWRVMPVVAMWTLGSGRSEVVGLCRKVGITVIEVSSPAHYRGGSGLAIHYLADESPRLFA